MLRLEDQVAISSRVSTIYSIVGPIGERFEANT